VPATRLHAVLGFLHQSAQSASCCPGVDQGGKAASGFSAPKATELATRAVIGPTAGWTCGELKLPSTTIGPRRARRLGRFDWA
jgi:hypothetical protein